MCITGLSHVPILIILVTADSDSNLTAIKEDISICLSIMPVSHSGDGKKRTRKETEAKELLACEPGNSNKAAAGGTALLALVETGLTLTSEGGRVTKHAQKKLLLQHLLFHQYCRS